MRPSSNSLVAYFMMLSVTDYTATNSRIVGWIGKDLKILS
jgi:hypothetical protein